MCARSQPASTHERQLDVERQAGRDPVRVDRCVVEAFRLEEDLVARLPAKRMTLSSIDGQYRGPTPWITPVNIGERSRPAG